MSPKQILLALGIAFVIAACSSGVDREWMKVNQPYTAAEFRKDYSQCEKTSNLDDCLRSRGWVSVTTPTTPKSSAPDMRVAPGMSAPAGQRPKY